MTRRLCLLLEADAIPQPSSSRQPTAVRLVSPSGCRFLNRPRSDSAFCCSSNSRTSNTKRSSSPSYTPNTGNRGQCGLGCARTMVVIFVVSRAAPPLYPPPHPPCNRVPRCCGHASIHPVPGVLRRRECRLPRLIARFPQPPENKPRPDRRLDMALSQNDTWSRQATFGASCPRNWVRPC